MKNFETKSTSNNLLKGTLIAGALFSVSALSASTTSSLYDYDTMGSGAEVRGMLLNASAPSSVMNFEMKCGEGKDTEAKCGEGEKKETKEAKKEGKSESKATEAKCGEGKCGEKKAETKKEAKEESKATEAKCGEGKCGK